MGWAAGFATEDQLEICRRLRLVHPALESLRFERVTALDQTVAGKTRRVMPH